MLLLYDYSLTLPLEVSQIWSSRFTTAKLFYFFNRYGAILNFCLNCVLNALQTRSILVRSFYSSSVDSDNSSRREFSAWSITCFSSSCSCKILFAASHVINEVADTGLIGQQAYTIQRETAHFLIGIFALRTFAIYNNNWIVLSALTFLGTGRILIALVMIKHHIMSAVFLMGTCAV